jgi:hypothetical protein
MDTAFIPPVDPLIPFLKGIAMVGLRPTKGYAELAAGRLKAVRNGRRTFIRASEVERYIRSLEAASVKEDA